MLIYNVTSKVDHSIHESWVEWMKNKHIPQVMETGCFSKFQFVRVLDIDESDGATYAIQYYANTKEDYERYIDQFSITLRNDVLQTWGNKIAGFRSLMQVVH
jgi:hypothetical protein